MLHPIYVQVLNSQLLLYEHFRQAATVTPYGRKLVRGTFYF